VVSLQNHDQVGNRATGDRIGMLASPARARIGALLLLTSPYVPLLFQGEEWAAATPFLYFTDHDAELGAHISAGRRREFAAFGWDPASIPDPQDPGTFERSKLGWDELRREPHSTHFSLDEALAVAAELAPRRTLLTHISHDLEHAATSATLPPGVELAYDGLSVPLS